MKKIVLGLLLLFPLLAKAQYGSEIVTGPANPTYVFLGSLPVSDVGNLMKLKVDILGGSWEAYSNGETTYYIANREGLKIDRVTMVSANESRYSLHAYTTATGGIDFYLLTSGYTAMAIRSCMLGQNAKVLINNTTSLSPPSGVTEITALTINPILVTDVGGNIGINTASPDPAYKFSVNGKLRAKEVKVETGWADYVFDKDYALRALKEVGSYIDQNHHLPEVPSAQEVEKNGINLGETNALLLKKIEELTLYLIEKDKQINSQQSQMNQLQQQLGILTKEIRKK